jgi:oxygen-independent coproporphyrinogen-3 oxidase
MFDLIESGKLELPTEELERKMYWLVKNILEKNGYNHYEISNFSKSKYESKHNMNCWSQHSYLGFGLAAHSYYDGIRYSNITDLKAYIKNYKNDESIFNVVFHEHQDKRDMMKEYMVLGLRKIEGVHISEFKNKFVDNPLYVFRKELNKLTSEDLLIIDDDVIKLTSKGLDFANLVWMEFV